MYLLQININGYFAVVVVDLNDSFFVCHFVFIVILYRWFRFLLVTFLSPWINTAIWAIFIIHRSADVSISNCFGFGFGQLLLFQFHFNIVNRLLLKSSLTNSVQ